ncbi:uncharacterized protein [Epargyreus clarus]|uniref:uncharacterized protein n=1 Tax=Epargyreus clarus TaxID=520877 RepID=UPI003C2DC61D
MVNWILFLLALLLSTFATSLQEEATTPDYDYDDDYYDDPEPVNNLNQKEHTTISPKILKKTKKEVTTNIPKIKVKRDREELTTEKQFAKYEVTELVIDIPDTNTRRPILTNFTVTRPLNFAGVPTNKVNASTNFKDEGDEVINSIFAPDLPKVDDNKPDSNARGRGIKFDERDDKETFLDDFNSKSFFDDDSDEDDDFFDFGFEDEPKTKSFRDYFHNIKKDISSGFDSVINQHKDIDHSLHKFANPLSFLSKLHKKGSELAKKIHNAVSRHKVQDDFEDSFEDDC